MNTTPGNSRTTRRTIAASAREGTSWHTSALKKREPAGIGCGFGTLATYTWAHAIDNSEYRNTTSGPERLRGNAAGDLRHRFTLIANYDLPLAKNARGLGGALGRGWRLNSIGVMQTGSPFSVSNSAPRCNTGAGGPTAPASTRNLTKPFSVDLSLAGRS